MELDVVILFQIHVMSKFGPGFRGKTYILMYAVDLIYNMEGIRQSGSITDQYVSNALALFLQRVTTHADILRYNLSKSYMRLTLFI